MSESYCGKSCAECRMKEKISCPGCITSEAGSVSADCEIARCCRDKGHEHCATCNFQKEGCRLAAARRQYPGILLERREAEELSLHRTMEKVPFLTKWLRILFWVFLAGLPVSVLNEEFFLTALPFLRIPLQVLGYVLDLGYGLVLLRLSAAASDYKIAGWCSIALSLVSVPLNLAAEHFDNSAWSLLFVLPMLGLRLLAYNKEFTAHAEILAGVDNELSDRWEQMCKWMIWAVALSFGSLVLILMIPWLGALAMLAGSTGTIILGILEPVYLYRTAVLFRDYDRDMEDQT